MSITDELEKLDQLRQRGVLTDDEFAREKKKILKAPDSTTANPSSFGTTPTAAMQRAVSSTGETIPFYRLPLFMLIVTVLFPPAILAIIWTGPIYRRDNPAKEYVPFSTGWKIFFSAFALFWLLKWIAYVFGS